MSFSDIVDGQNIDRIPEFTLESGAVIYDVPVAYKTWGKLNETRDNVMIICHAFTGSADVEDWWGPMMGPGKAFDSTRYFVFCGNVMGSPYGSASPLSVNPSTGKPYGPEFPSTTIRDDVRLHKLVLDKLGVRSVAVVIGGSMGGMAVLEWPLCTPENYIRHIIPIATSSRQSAWGISWSEAQRQSIYSDPLYLDGYYDAEKAQPKTGLAAARMAALLTYRSRDSFETRFGRKTQIRAQEKVGVLTPPQSPPTPAHHALAIHNDGHKSKPLVRSNSGTSIAPPPPIFSAQSYLRYQGDKFTARFDANCYIHISRKMDSHDVARGRGFPSSSTIQPSTSRLEGDDDYAILKSVLGTLPKGAIVISIQTDGLFTPSEQHELAAHIPEATLITVQSPDGHDGFLLEFEQINRHILKFLHDRLPELYVGPTASDVGDATLEDFAIKKTSKFGEAEADITQW